MINIILLFASIFVIVKGADYAIKHASSVAQTFRLPTFVVGFLVVAVISILPETFIAAQSAIGGVPELGLGTLFGSNVADLSIVFAIIVFASKKGVKVSSSVLKRNALLPLLLGLPIFVGSDGHYTRLEGILLIIAGVLFYYTTLRNARHHTNVPEITSDSKHRYKAFLGLIVSTAILLFGSYATVLYGVSVAQSFSVNPVLVGILIVGLGTTLPELFFSVRAIRRGVHDLAAGDIFGTVVSDGTIAVGLMAAIYPFDFPVRIVYVTAAFTVVAAFLLLEFMRSDKILSKKEGLILLCFYVVFVLTEYMLTVSL